jgi:hypothetical protein
MGHAQKKRLLGFWCTLGETRVHGLGGGHQADGSRLSLNSLCKRNIFSRVFTYWKKFSIFLQLSENPAAVPPQTSSAFELAFL